MKMNEIITDDELKAMIKNFKKSLVIDSEYFVKIERVDLTTKFQISFNKKDKNFRAYNKDYKMRFYIFEFIIFLTNYTQKKLNINDLIEYKKTNYQNDMGCASGNMDIALKMIEEFRKGK